MNAYKYIENLIYNFHVQVRTFGVGRIVFYVAKISD